MEHTENTIRFWHRGSFKIIFIDWKWGDDDNNKLVLVDDQISTVAIVCPEWRSAWNHMVQSCRCYQTWRNGMKNMDVSSESIWLIKMRSRIKKILRAWLYLRLVCWLDRTKDGVIKVNSQIYTSSNYSMDHKFKLKALLETKVKLVFVSPISRTIPHDENGNIMGYEYMNLIIQIDGMKNSLLRYELLRCMYL